MFLKKDSILYEHLLKIFLVASFLVLTGMRFLSPTQAYAATGKAGAELLVNGNIVKLTPASSSRTARSHVVQECAFVMPSETNVSNNGTTASFDFSLRVDNRCPYGVAVTRGSWATQGSVLCNGTWYDNPPSETGNIPHINAGSSALLRDQVPYEAVCIGEILDVIPYTYPPAAIEINTAAFGPLSNENTWSDAQSDSFIP